MDLRVFMTVFGTVFLAELGDKTQLATLLYAAEKDNPKLLVFAAASSALVSAVAVAVVAGMGISRWVDPKYLSMIAGAGFIVIGVWTMVRSFAGG